jgi:hypothetical protein
MTSGLRIVTLLAGDAHALGAERRSSIGIGREYFV